MVKTCCLFLVGNDFNNSFTYRYMNKEATLKKIIYLALSLLFNDGKFGTSRPLSSVFYVNFFLILGLLS